MLNVNLQNVAIVVLSDGNNPRLLNQDFLERNGIVSKDLKVENVLVTPPFSQVAYANGLQILVEENKLQFVSSLPDLFDWKAELPKISTTYLRVLPHVSYRAVGLNLNYKCEDLLGAEAESRLIKEMLREGPWLTSKGGVTGTTIELRYRSSQPHMNVKIGLSEEPPKGKGDKKARVLVLNVNFHHGFLPDRSGERERFMDTLKFRHDEFLEFLKILPF